MLPEAHQILLASFDHQHTGTARAAIWLGVCAADLGSAEEVVRLLSGVFEVQRQALRSGHPHLLETERALADR